MSEPTNDPIGEILRVYSLSHEEGHNGAAAVDVADTEIAHQALSNLLLKAKMDELMPVQLDYGHQRAQTFIHGKPMSVLDRYKELETELADLQTQLNNKEK